MKPDWENAPKWARYCAMDKDGTWWWYDIEPLAIGGEWVPDMCSSVMKVRMPQWQESLFQRPEGPQ